MTEYVLSFKANVGLYGRHDPSAALFEDGDLAFMVEEERFTREKHATDDFPHHAIQACLDARDITLEDVDRILIPHIPDLRQNILFSHYLPDALRADGVLRSLLAVEDVAKTMGKAKLRPDAAIETNLKEFDGSIPQIEHVSHHRAHAASAFHPSGFDDAVVLTIDAKGEYDSTVVWHGDTDGLTRLQTYEHPNSLGLFFAIVTEFLGYHMFNGEGKVMGLAPYGDVRESIEAGFRDLITTGVDYDVTDLTTRWGTGAGVQRLEETFDRDRVSNPTEFGEWEQDFAATAQHLLEETILAIVEDTCTRLGVQQVGLAGGVVLNCKLNKRIRESDPVEDLFIQPIANDAGLALGAGLLEQDPTTVDEQTSVAFGPAYEMDTIQDLLDEAKLDYQEPDELETKVATRLADGDLVGWFHGPQEVGPRALGRRSILADPRDNTSRDRVNEYVKHREEWRPFAPSILAEYAADYLQNATESPFMIDTFDVEPDRCDEVEAILHPADDTTRPQTVSPETNPRYHRLIAEFHDQTGVPMVLNTSFNDHGEPIVTTPTQAIKDFAAMGLDLLVLEDAVLEKPLSTTD